MLQINCQSCLKPTGHYSRYHGWIGIPGKLVPTNIGESWSNPTLEWRWLCLDCRESPREKELREKAKRS